MTSSTKILNTFVPGFIEDVNSIYDLLKDNKPEIDDTNDQDFKDLKAKITKLEDEYENKAGQSVDYHYKVISPHAKNVKKFAVALRDNHSSGMELSDRKQMSAKFKKITTAYDKAFNDMNAIRSTESTDTTQNSSSTGDTNSEEDKPSTDENTGMSWLIVLIVLVVLIFSGIGFVVWKRRQQ